MKKKPVFAVAFLILAFTLSIMGCSASKSDEDVVVVKKKKAPPVEYSSVSSIEKKSLINQSTLEILTDIVSEYRATSSSCT